MRIHIILIDIKTNDIINIVMAKQINDFITDKKKNDKLIKERFCKFINQEKDFGDDVFSVIKDFMIEPRFKKSYKFQQQKELRYCESGVDATTFFIGRRYKNLIQVKQTRTHDDEVIENPQFKFYKIKTMEMKNAEDETDIILLEYLDILCDYQLNYYDGGCDVCYYRIGADKFNNKLWNDCDSIKYLFLMKEQQERDEEDYNDYVNDIEMMML
jgi:hypothetical protein